MVNTFLPYADFHSCAKVLDNKRLGKQRVEAKQIINIVSGHAKSAAWTHHPAVLMWKGHINALRAYYNEIVTEWISRGYINNMPFERVKNPVKLPWFMGNKTFHLTFQANLLRKDNTHYKKYFKSVPDEYLYYTYLWPSNLSNEQRSILIKYPNKRLQIDKFTTRHSYL